MHDDVDPAVRGGHVSERGRDRRWWGERGGQRRDDGTGRCEVCSESEAVAGDDDDSSVEHRRMVTMGS